MNSLKRYLFGMENSNNFQINLSASTFAYLNYSVYPSANNTFKTDVRLCDFYTWRLPGVYNLTQNKM